MTAPVACFMIELAGRARYLLRRYQDSWIDEAGTWHREHQSCPSSGTGYHNAENRLDDVTCRRVTSRGRDRDDTWMWEFDDPDKPAHNDPRWPKACACGYVFLERDQWQVFHDIIWRAADGSEFGDHELPPGAMRDVAFYGYDKMLPKPSPDGKALFVVLPCGHDWFIDGPANNGPMGWTRTGTPPVITVTPSIQCGPSCYHGWLRNGVLTPV